MIELDENPYVGLNPHLMSLFQSPSTEDMTSTFPPFHGDHITHIKDFLNRYLPRTYIAVSESSLQIKARQSDYDPLIRDSRPVPDVAVYQRGAMTQQAAAHMASPPALHLELELEELQQIMGISIYEIKAGEHRVYSKPLVRIELLSPANMPGESYDAAYQQNRTKMLLAGTPLIEIDYLHEYPSPIIGVPYYPKDKGSKPYYIALSNPKVKGVDVYLFDLDEPIPIVPIPLAGDEVLNFDFGEPFVYTWQTSRFGTFIDYAHEPARMESYSPADQTKIREKMAEVAKRTR
ncbi:MAG: DUF4058 family protein [Anaerolineae bacterium]|nr:DUF4058 family protein [Anaerolineae bacterium]